MDFLNTPPAGTPVTRNQGISNFEFRQIYPRNSVKGNWSTERAGLEVQIPFSVDPGTYMIPSMSRIFVKLHARRHTADNMQHATTPTSYQSLKFAACPVAALFSSARFSVMGQTLEASTDLHDLDCMRRRLTSMPGVKNSTLSLENFSQKMSHKTEPVASAANKEVAHGNQLFTYNEDLNEKQRLISYAVADAAEVAHSKAGSTSADALVGNASATAMTQVEIAGHVPLSS